MGGRLGTAILTGESVAREGARVRAQVCGMVAFSLACAPLRQNRL